ncbi:hypothetical protein [Acinetobacter baumannii]|nr:hypothetical protein [Acinetobacter baumannii]
MIIVVVLPLRRLATVGVLHRTAQTAAHRMTVAVHHLRIAAGR